MMKNLLYIIFSILCVANLNGQFEVMIEDSDDDLLVYDLADSADKSIGYSVINNTNEVVEWYWTVEPGDDFPEEWSFQVCDTRNCYGFGVDMSPADRPNTANPGTLTSFENTYVHVSSNGVDASSYMVFKIYDNANFIDPVFVSNIPTSTINVNVDDLKVFPNPTSDYFNIQDDISVKSISIYNIVGKEIKSFNHTPGMEHDVKDLRNGMYLLRLMDNNNKVIKTMRLSKR